MITLRWRLRKLLNLLPARRTVSAGLVPIESIRKKRIRIVYLFTGTYGDFVQILRTVQTLGQTFPEDEVILYGASRYAQEFALELPNSVRPAEPWEPWHWLFSRPEMLLTNAVGVYRVRFDYFARFASRQAYGFRHSHEIRRGGYQETIPLVPSVHSFAEENLKLLEVAGIRNLDRIFPAWKPDYLKDQNLVTAKWGKDKIFFHIGSAGLKKDFGIKIYSRLVREILLHLKGQNVEVVMGPGDEDIAFEVCSGTDWVPQMFPVSRLIKNLRTFEGTVLCFNSFLAHLCHYLDCPAIVIHRLAVPFGYDCAPLHYQVVLGEENDWNLTPVWQALERKSPKV
jgi:hypothetical protein